VSSQTFVIAIAGPSGAGKSTLIDCLVARMGNSNALSLDDYRDSSIYPSVREWLEGGADPNQFQIPQLAADVFALKAGKTVIHPATREVINPARYLLLEEHFGRGRIKMRELIDFVVYLETPLEIAHARKLLRKNDFLPWEDNPNLFIQNLREHLGWYLNFGRDFYLAVKTSALKDCDLILNGELPTQQIADQIIAALPRK
jgi:uridine kinase